MGELDVTHIIEATFPQGDSDLVEWRETKGRAIASPAIYVVAFGT